MVPYRIIQIPWCVASLAQRVFEIQLCWVQLQMALAWLYSVPLSEYVICLSDGNDNPVCKRDTDV